MDFMMDIKVKKVHPDAKMPKRGSVFAAGFDLYAVSVEERGNMVVYDTGLAFEIPEGYVGLLFPRSSVANSGLSLTNSVGVLDSDYRGTVRAKFYIVDSTKKFFDKGERICQIVVMPVPLVEFSEAECLSDTERGVGGFGSTGRY